MYDKFYRLSGSPFRLNPDPNFFFGSKIHNRALAYLHYGLNQKEGFIVVTGSPGMGKTTLARALLREAAKDRLVVSELNTTHLRADDVLRMVAASFGLEHENLPKSTLLKRLEAFLMSRHRAGYHALLLVDEAQNLPPDSLEELRMLSNFYTGNHALLQIFLLGQQQFKELLYSPEMEQLRQRVVAACHLEPLDELESREYIEHRLGVVGWKNNPHITDEAFDLIFKLTEGVPRRINTFCERLFLFGAMEEKKVLDGEAVRAVAKELTSEVSGNTHQAKQLMEETAAQQEATVATEREPRKRTKPPAPESVPEKPAAAVEPAEKVRPASLRVVSSKGVATKPVEQPLTEMESEIEVLKEHAEVDLDAPWLDLVAVAWSFLHSPWTQPHLTDPNTPLAEGIDQLINVALGRTTVPTEFFARKLENATEALIKEAARNYIKQVLLSPRADYYRRLGVHRYAEIDQIKRHYQLLFRLFQPDQEEDPIKWNESYSRRINQAYGTLRDSDRRKKYDEYLNGIDRRKDVPSVSSRGTVSQGFVDEARAEASSPAPLPVVKGAAGEKSFNDLESLPLITNPARLETDAVPAVMPQPAQPKHENAPRPVGVWVVVAVLGVLLVGGVAAWLQFSRSPDTESVRLPADLSPIERGPTEPSTELLPQEQTPAPVINPPLIQEQNAASPVTPSKEDNAKPVEESPPPVVKAKKEKPARHQESSESIPKSQVKEAELLPVDPQTNGQSSTAQSDSPRSISRRELDRLVNRLLFVYEGGDIEQFIALFAENAVTNDRTNKADIRRDYASLFSSTEMRVLELPNLQWEVSGDSAKGIGAFTVTVLKKGGQESKSFRGTMELGVERQDKSLRVNRFVYTYDKR